MQHFYRDVPTLGHVAISRHAQARMEADGITDEMLRLALFEPTRITPDGLDIQLRERGDIRIVIQLYPTPNRGARLVTSVHRAKPKLIVGKRA